MEKINKLKNKKSLFLDILLGLIIGFAIIIPGTSGSSFAVLFNRYDQIIHAIANIKKQFKQSVKFLIPILIGVVAGFLFGMIFLNFALKAFPLGIMFLFAGFMLHSSRILFKNNSGNKSSLSNLILLFIGIALPILLSFISIKTNNDNHWIFNKKELPFTIYLLFFILGYLISITQIIPGLSASALLMCLGYFQILIESFSFHSLKDNQTILFIYLALLLGFFIGILVNIKCINWLLKTKRKSFYQVIKGLTISSIICLFYNSDMLFIYAHYSFNIASIIDYLLSILLLLFGYFASELIIKKIILKTF